MDPPEYAFEGNIVDVRNDSGSAMPRFSVAGFSDILISPSQNLQEFQNYPRFSLRTPQTPDDQGKFCVTLEPLATGAIGKAMISGVCPCQVWRSPGDTAQAFADVKNGQIGYLQQST